MLENALQPNERLRDNPLGLHLQALATSFMEDGYADVTVRLKLGCLRTLGGGSDEPSSPSPMLMSGL